MNAPSKPALTRSPGFWLALLMIVSQAANALRATFDPVGFAGYLGLPLAAGVDPSWVQVYGLRTTFIALLAGWLLATRQIRTLSLVALLAVFIPVGDLWLVWQADGPAAKLARHSLLAIFVLATWFFLRRWSVRAGGENLHPGRL